jgi:hypothetical protein
VHHRRARFGDLLNVARRAAVEGHRECQATALADAYLAVQGVSPLNSSPLERHGSAALDASGNGECGWRDRSVGNHCGD